MISVLIAALALDCGFPGFVARFADQGLKSLATGVRPPVEDGTYGGADVTAGDDDVVAADQGRTSADKDKNCEDRAVSASSNDMPTQSRGHGTQAGDENIVAADQGRIGADKDKNVEDVTVSASSKDMPTQSREHGTPGSDVIAGIQARVVKLTGAAVGSQKGFGSGVLVSADGLIVTAASPLLDGATVVVTLGDGRIADGKLVRRDDVRQLALLKVELSAAPHFDLSLRPDEIVGAGVIAAGNAFKVAEGAEAVSITHGVLAGRARMAARYRLRTVAYRGEVLLTDAIVSAPGMGGGALVDLQGALLGVIGRPVKSERTNTWLNYAMPVEQVAEFVNQTGNPDGQLAAGETHRLEAGATRADRLKTGPTPAGATGVDGERVLSKLGLRLFDVGGRWRPAYVERVRALSAAEKAGVRAEDLILSIGEISMATCDDVRQVLAEAPAGDSLTFVVKRGDTVKSLEVLVEPAFWVAEREPVQ